MRSGLEGVNLIANTMGFLSFFLLWLTVVWGIVLRAGWAPTRIRHATLYGVHQTLALLGLCLGVVHAFALHSIPGGAFEIGRERALVPRWTDLVIPFTSRLETFGVGLGVLGLEILIAIAASVLVQRRLGYNRWRALHNVTHAAFALLVAHIMVTGADPGPVYIWGSVVTCWLTAVGLWLGTAVWAVVADTGMGRRFRGRRGTQVVVNVDTLKCERTGFCVQAAPTLFKLRGDGRLSYRASVYTTEIDAAVRAAESCPVRAISLGLTATAVLTAQSMEQDVSQFRTASSMNRNRGV